MNYGALITRAFRITTRHKFLWLLGILAGGFGGGGGGGGGGDEPPSELLRHASDWALAHIYLVIALGIILFLVMLAFFVLSVMARAGLISSVARIEGRQAASFMTGIRSGYHAFWRLIAIGLLIFLAVLAMIALVAPPIIVLILTKHYWAAGGWGLLVLPVLIVAAVYLGILWMYAIRFAVLGTAGVRASLKRAHSLLFTRTKEVLLVWLIALGLGLAASIATLLVILVIALPLAAVGVGIYLTLGLIPTVVYAIGPALMLFAAGLLLSGIVNTFNSSLWTLAYLDLTTHPTQPAPLPAVTPTCPTPSATPPSPT